MREVLFKAQRTDTKEWIEGFPIIMFGHTYMITLANAVYPYDTETLCQYTGLDDATRWEELSQSEKEKFCSGWNHEENRKNKKEDWQGRKIFENDILKVFCSLSEISICRAIFRDGMFIGELADGGEDSIIAAEKVYVIGNVLDNPELFKNGSMKYK